MAKLNRGNDILHKLNSEIVTSNLRPYSGLSGVGGNCIRSMQMAHYWMFKQHISTRIQRLFNVGHDAESTMIADLAKVGIIVEKQQREIIATAGHWRGHTDGQAKTQLDGEFLVEFKTHNQSSFADLLKKKVKVSKSAHYAQCQAYMGYLGLKKALYMALNKNTSEYYIEWIEFDEPHFKDLQRVELEVIMADALLPRIGNNNITWFECKMCDCKNQCFGKTRPEENCRTCSHVDVMDDGIWACSHKINKHKAKSKELTVQEQQEGCDSYQLADMLKV